MRQKQMYVQLRVDDDIDKSASAKQVDRALELGANGRLLCFCPVSNSHDYTPLEIRHMSLFIVTHVASSRTNVKDNSDYGIGLA